MLTGAPAHGSELDLLDLHSLSLNSIVIKIRTAENQHAESYPRPTDDVACTVNFPPARFLVHNVVQPRATSIECHARLTQVLAPK